MADKRDVFDDDFLARNNEPQLSHTLESAPEPSGVGSASAVGKKVKGKSSDGPWYKHPETIKVVVAAVVVVVIVLVVLIWQFGLFGGSDDSKQPIAAAPNPTPQPAANTVAPQQQPPESQPPANNIVSGKTIPQPGTPVTPPEEKKAEEPPEEEKEPPLPDDVAKWKGASMFNRARREKNPKLLEAVAYLGSKKYAGNEFAAKGLIKLLKPLEPEEPTEKPDEKKPDEEKKPSDAATPAPDNPKIIKPAPVGTEPPGAQPNKVEVMPGLVEAIVTALGNNGSPPARETIEGILAGTFTTDDDKAAVEAALKTLVAHHSEENDALLLRVLTEPAVLRPFDRQGPWPEKEFQAKAFELTKESASGALRLALAKILIERRVAINSTDPMHQFLMASDPLNCAAQLAFYEKGQIPPEQKKRLEEQFLDYGSLAMADYLSIPENLEQPTADASEPKGHGADPGGLIGGFEIPGTPAKPGAKAGEEESKPEKENPARAIAAGLWSPKFIAMLKPKLAPSAVDTLENHKKFWLLAGTIPQDSTRELLNNLFRKHWEEGPKALESSDLTGKVVTDPGLLAVLKMLPRSDAKSSGRGNSRTSHGAAGKINKRIAEAQKKQKLEQEWMDFTAKLVPLWCKRFHAATVVRQNALENSDIETAPPLVLPEGFEISSGARVLGSFYLSWPDEAPPEIAALNPGFLKVHYIRLEEMNKPRTATAFYRRQIDPRTADAHTIDKVTWLDGVKVGSEKNQRRSLDVLITPPDGYTAPDDPRKETEVNLIVEILSVEIVNPHKQ